jgi:hypothetical protein
VIYIATTFVLFLPSVNKYIPVGFLNCATPISILALDVVWILGMILLKQKNLVVRKAKILFSVLILSLSASVLSFWCFAKVFMEVW